MPTGIGTATLIAGLAGAGAGVFGAAKQSSSANKAAKLQTESANHAADVQGASADKAEAFQRQQAEQQWRESQATQRANYDQWRARQGTIAAFGAQYGVPGMDIPEYQAGIDPHYDSGGSPVPGSVGAASGPAGAGPAVDASKGDLAWQISSYFKSRGVSDHETPYWVSKWSEFGAKDPAYFNKRLAAADVFGGGSAAPAPKGSIASYGMPPPPTTMVAPTTALPTPYQPGSIHATTQRRY